MTKKKRPSKQQASKAGEKLQDDQSSKAQKREAAKTLVAWRNRNR